MSKKYVMLPTLWVYYSFWMTVGYCSLNTPDDSKRRGPAYYTQRLMIPFDDLYRGRWKVKQAFLGFLTGFWKPFTSLQISWNLQMVVYISIEKHKPNRLLKLPNFTENLFWELCCWMHFIIMKYFLNPISRTQTKPVLIGYPSICPLFGQKR